jgi:predicted transporter
MCPMCFATVALTIAATTSTGGITALVVKKLRTKANAKSNSDNQHHKEMSS